MQHSCHKAIHTYLHFTTMDVRSEILMIQNRVKCQFQPKVPLYLLHYICNRVRKEPWLTELSSLAKNDFFKKYFFNSI